MKLTCTKTNLKKALNLTSKVISTTSTLPILNNLLFKAEAGQLKISSTNLEIAIKTWVGGQIEEIGEITIPAKTITDFVNNTTEEKITMFAKGNDLTVKTEATQSVIKGLPADEFPLIPELKPTVTIQLPAGELSEALSQVAFATAFSEVSPELSGVLFVFEGSELRLAATDRYRLAEKVLPLQNEINPSQKFIIPNRAVGELIRLLGDEPKTVDILVSENQVMFRGGSAELMSRVVDGQYPDYRQIIPNNFNSEIKTSVGDFLSAVKLSGLFAQDNNNVEVVIDKTKQQLIFNSASQKSGTNTTHVKGEITGDDNRIVFNYRYLLDYLNHTKEEKMVLKMIDANSSAMLVPEKDKNYLYLVMPIKT